MHSHAERGNEKIKSVGNEKGLNTKHNTQNTFVTRNTKLS